MRIALAGNPNSGKTTMYNALTGKNEKVGNWAGVTVDKRESLIKKSFSEGSEEIVVVDLPGAYSMSPFTSEESITSSYVKNENPDVIINIVDATNLSRSLFFTTQLMELDVPVVVALNKSDINEKKETKIDVAALSAKLGCPVVETISTTSSNKGLAEVAKVAIDLKGKSQEAPYKQEDVDMSDKNAVVEADKKRFDFVNDIVKGVEKRKVATKDKNINDTIDAIITNKFAGILIFAAVMWGVFWVSQAWLGPIIADYIVGWIETFGEFVAGKVENAAPILQTILVDGIIGGVGAVVGFLPLVMVMYILLALLEDCGYMARVSVVLDPIFKKVGLSGKSVIPLVVGTGCAVPGIMASRTIRDERERRATAMLTPFIPCGAKIPVIALFAGAFFPESGWVSPVVYFVGILLVFLGALLVKAISGYKFKKSFFIIELPEYKLPSVKRAFFVMLDRAKEYVIKAGTIILVCNALVSIMASYEWNFEPVPEIKVGEVIMIDGEEVEGEEIEFDGEKLVVDGEEVDITESEITVEDEMVGDTSKSILASIASPFAVILIPLGFGAWQLAAAAITGFIAKEEVVGTLAAVFAVGGTVINGDFELLNAEAFVDSIKVAGVEFTKVAALGYLMFNLYTPPCFAAIGAMNSEIKSKKWLFAGIGLQLAVGYTVAFLVYQIGTPIVYGEVGNGLVPGLIAEAVIVAIIAALAINSRKKTEG
ncbi:MAG: ferrous iron transport protein B [Lachnospiraceae bacterium]|nr:ferrous iron transport protein B [Lachnospiraceae bacterium]